MSRRVFRVETTASTGHPLRRAEELCNAGTTNNFAAHTDYAKIRDDELMRRFMELRRVYLSFEKFIRDAHGLELKSE